MNLPFFKNRKIKLPGFVGTHSAAPSESFESFVTMPPGYKLQTDGKKFRFVHIGNGHESSAYGTPQYTAEIAWHVYEDALERRSNSAWKDVTTDQ